MDPLPSSVYLHTRAAVATALQTGGTPQLNLDEMAQVADLHAESPTDSGPIFRFQDSNHVEHALSVADFEAAGDIFKGLELQVDKRHPDHATVVVAPHTASLMGTLSQTPPGTISTAASGSASGTVTPARLIHITGGQQMTVYGTFPPNVEKALADGWLSSREMSDLWQSGQHAVNGSVDDGAHDMIEMLTQRQVQQKSSYAYAYGDHLGLNGTELDTWRSLNGEAGYGPRIANLARETGVGGQITRYEHFLHQTPSFNAKGHQDANGQTVDILQAAKKQGVSVQAYNMNRFIADIQDEPTIAPDDKAALVRLAQLRYVMAYPTEASRGADMDLPVPTRTQIDLYQTLDKKGNYLQLDDLAKQLGL